MRFAALALGATIIVAACSSFDESAETPPPQGGDAGADAGPLPDACSNHVLYVSGANGNDANDGCSPERAIKTIGAALAFATGRKLDGFDIHVCGGTYAEVGVRLATPVSLHGQFNCATWMHGAENLTRIENSGYPSTPTTLTIAGNAIGRNVVVDGFTIVAPAAGDRPSVAVAVVEGAKPLLSNLEIVGGGTKGTQPMDAAASVGLDIHGGASPEVAACKISGGTGTAVSGAGSVAVTVFEGGAIDIHDSVVDSGTGTGLAGGVGIRLVDVPKSTITKVRVTYGGKVTSTTPYAAMGVWASGGDVVISQSNFHGGLGSCGTAATCEITGVRADTAAKIAMSRTAIYSGDLEASTVTPVSYGIFLGENVVGNVMSNVVHAGSNASDKDSVAVAIEVEATKSTRIVGNTLLMTGASAGGGHSAIRFYTPMGGGTGDNIVNGNVFVGRGENNDVALALTTCGGAHIDSLKRNAFIDFPLTLADVINTVPGCTGGQGIVRLAVSDLENHVKTLGGASQGNVLMRPSCSAECIPSFDCASAAACAAKVFASWDDASGGLTNMESATGLRVAPGAPCAIVKGDPPVVGDADIDFFGTPRTAPTSMGHEESETCQ